MKTGAEIRHEAKERVKQYRENMKAKGYLSTTIFLSKAHREELKRLGVENRLTRAEAAEHIFSIYLESDIKNITRTIQEQAKQEADSTAIIESLKEKIKHLEERDAKRDKEFSEILSKMNTIFEKQSKPAIKPKQVDLFKALEEGGQEDQKSIFIPSHKKLLDIDPHYLDNIQPETPEKPSESTLEFEPELSHTDGTTRQERDVFEGNEPCPNNKTLQFEDESPIKANVGTIFEDPPSIDEPEAYRKWIDAVLLELSGDGLSNKEICTELMERGIKTPKGKDRWYPVGVHAMLNHLRLQQEEAQAINEPTHQPDEPKIGSPEYRDWLFEKITELRAEGMTYGKIEGYLNDNGILTVTGKPWGRNAVYAFFKKRSG